MTNQEAKTAQQVEELAVQLFDAYNSQGPNPWRTWDGKEVPGWGSLNDQVQGKWFAAARLAIQKLRPA